MSDASKALYPSQLVGWNIKQASWIGQSHYISYNFTAWGIIFTHCSILALERMLNNFHRSQFEQLRIKTIAIYFTNLMLFSAFSFVKKKSSHLTFS